MAFSPSRPKPPNPVSRSKILRGKLPHSMDEHRINERIRVPKVRLIDEKGTQVGIIETREALRMARDRDLDLMEVAPNARPPVCKIIDYGKFKYEKKKKESQARKHQTVIKVKEVQIRPNTDTHDYNFKMKNVRSFLEEGDKVKITMLFRGRQIAHSQNGREMLNKMAEDCKELCTLEQPPRMDGRKLIMILAPVKKKLSLSQRKAAREKAEKEATKEGAKEAPATEGKQTSSKQKD